MSHFVALYVLTIYFDNLLSTFFFCLTIYIFFNQYKIKFEIKTFIMWIFADLKIFHDEEGRYLASCEFKFEYC